MTPRARRKVAKGRSKRSTTAASWGGMSQRTSSPSRSNGRSAAAIASESLLWSSRPIPGHARSKRGTRLAGGCCQYVHRYFQEHRSRRAAHMRRHAASAYSGMRSVRSTRADHLVTEAMIGIWSADIPAPRSNDAVLACAPMINNGVPAIFDTSAGVTVLVTRGRA